MGRRHFVSALLVVLLSGGPVWADNWAGNLGEPPVDSASVTGLPNGWAQPSAGPQYAPPPAADSFTGPAGDGQRTWSNYGTARGGAAWGVATRSAQPAYVAPPQYYPRGGAYFGADVRSYGAYGLPFGAPFGYGGWQGAVPWSGYGPGNYPGGFSPFPGMYGW